MKQPANLVNDYRQKPKAKKTATSKAAPKKLSQTTLKMKPSAAKSSKKNAKLDSENEPSEDVDMSDNDSVLSSTPPKKVKGAAAPKKKPSKPLAANENESGDIEEVNEPSEEKDVSEKYQMVSYPGCVVLEVLLADPFF